MPYNIEMTEITGGTFWRAYTPGPISGTESFPPITNLQDTTAMTELMQYYPSIDLSNERLRKLARELGAAWICISGTWAAKACYDFEGTTAGKGPLSSPARQSCPTSRRNWWMLEPWP